MKSLNRTKRIILIALLMLLIGNNIIFASDLTNRSANFSKYNY